MEPPVTAVKKTVDCDDKPKKSLKHYFKNVTVEPLVFFGTASFFLGLVLTQSLLIRKVCRQSFNETSETCSNLTSNKKLELRTQHLATEYNMYKNIIDTVPQVVLSLFLGAWSDVNGRKMLLVVPNIGVSLSSLFSLLNAYFEMEMGIGFLLVAGLPSAFTGSFISIIVGATSYVSDISTAESRSFRIAATQAAVMSGIPFGTIIGGFIFQKYGYIAVFGTSTVLSFVCAMYALFYLKETIVKEHNGEKKSEQRMCQTRFFTGGFKVCFKKRENNKKVYICLMVIALVIAFLPTVGDIQVQYLYARLKFQWEESLYTTFTGIRLFAVMIGLMVVLPVATTVLKISDTTLVIAGVLSKLITELMVAFAEEGWVLFASCIVNVPSGIFPALIRSLLSQQVHPKELGRIFSVVGAGECAMPMVSSVVYTKVYQNTITTFPGAVFVMSASFCAISGIIFIWIIWSMKKQAKTEPPKKKPNIQDSESYI